MRERPILFKGPLVQAVLAGRKTVTRRLLTPQPEQSDIIAAWRWYGRTFAGGWSLTGTPPDAMLKDCPFGQPGDRLWVRETWSPDHRDVYPCPDFVYAADGTVLDAARFEVPREQLASPFSGREGQVSTRALVNWVEARKAVSHCEGPRSAGGLGLRGWEDVGGLMRLETVGLLTVALERLERTPEVGAGPLFPGLACRSC